MAEIPKTETVGNVFVEQYYTILHFKSEESYKFYENSSVATWNAKDAVTTLDGIREMIKSSDFKDCLIEVEDIHSQDSLQGSILVVVTGCATGEDKLKRKFNQTFLLVKHKTGFFVMNDILRFVDDKEPKSPKVADSETSNVYSEPARVSDDVCIQVEESSAAGEKSVSADSIDVKETAEAVAETQPEQTVSEVVSDMKDAAPKASYLEMLSKGKTSSTPTPATRFVRVSAFSVQEKAKLVAAHNGSRKATAVASAANNVTKDETPPTPTQSKTASETIHGPKGIYVGGLPPNTTENDLADAVKKFGIVKKFEGVQVIVLEDQFCYGFVHFQSADSAQKAVEAKVITVKGKEAYISYKKSGKNARAANGNDKRGRSPSGRGKSNTRAPSCNGHSSNGETRDPGANHYNSSNGHRSSDGSNGEANGWSDQRRRRDQRGRDGYASKRNGEQNDQRMHNRNALQDHKRSSPTATTAAVATGQQ